MPALAVALHVAAVVLWIGGVGFVTIIVFPMLMRMEDPLETVLAFQRFEKKFGLHAKVYLWVTGISGALLLYLTGKHQALFSAHTLGITLMMAAWLLYLAALTFEKRIFGRLFGGARDIDTKKVFKILNVFHWFMLGLSLLAVFLGVWQGHGGAL
jgi:uncharacterized membrane protein